MFCRERGTIFGIVQFDDKNFVGKNAEMTSLLEMLYDVAVRYTPSDF